MIGWATKALKVMPFVCVCVCVCLWYRHDSDLSHCWLQARNITGTYFPDCVLMSSVWCLESTIKRLNPSTVYFFPVKFPSHTPAASKNTRRVYRSGVFWFTNTHWFTFSSLSEGGGQRLQSAGGQKNCAKRQTRHSAQGHVCGCLSPWRQQHAAHR